MSSYRPSEVMQASIRKLAASQPLCCREDFFSPQSSLTSVCLATGKKMHGICLYFSKRISYIKNLSGQYPPPFPRFALTIPVNLLAKICLFFFFLAICWWISALLFLRFYPPSTISFHNYPTLPHPS